jgi:hypothetical protein
MRSMAGIRWRSSALLSVELIRAELRLTSRRGRI